MNAKFEDFLTEQWEARKKREDEYQPVLRKLVENANKSGDKIATVTFADGGLS